MSTKIPFVFGVCTLVLAMAACDTDRTGPASATAPPAGAAVAPAPSGADRAMSQAAALQTIVEIDQHEIAAAEQAQQKALPAEVKAFAETLRNDHSRNLTMSRNLLDGAGDRDAMGKSAIAELRSRHEAERRQLADLDGDAYQAAWLDAMVRGHADTLDKLDNQLIPAASDENVKRHLTETRDAIADHLQEAKALLGES